MSPEEANRQKKEFLELEYVSLRKEIETSRDRQFKIAAGALFGVPAIALLGSVIEDIGTIENIGPLVLALLGGAPVAVLSLYMIYFSEWGAIRRCACYIKAHIEAPTPSSPGWETWLEENAKYSYEVLQAFALHALYFFLFLVSVVAVATQVADWQGIAWGAFTAILYFLGGLYVLFAVHGEVKPWQPEDVCKKEEVHYEIEINASAERVWGILTDFASYRKWNPYIRKISGELEAGEQLEANLEPPGSRGRTRKLTVLNAEPDRKLRGRVYGLIPGLFDSEFSFVIEQLNGSSVRFVQSIALVGLRVPLFDPRVDSKTQRRGFKEMALALKEQAEPPSAKN